MKPHPNARRALGFSIHAGDPRTCCLKPRVEFLCVHGFQQRSWTRRLAQRMSTPLRRHAPVTRDVRASDVWNALVLPQRQERFLHPSSTGRAPNWERLQGPPAASNNLRQKLRVSPVPRAVALRDPVLWIVHAALLPIRQLRQQFLTYFLFQIDAICSSCGIQCAKRRDIAIGTRSSRML